MSSTGPVSSSQSSQFPRDSSVSALSSMAGTGHTSSVDSRCENSIQTQHPSDNSDNPFLGPVDDTWRDGDREQQINDPILRIKRELAIAFGDYDLGPEIRIPWRHLPRALTKSDCGSSPLRRSITAYTDTDNGTNVRLVTSDMGAADSTLHKHRGLSGSMSMSMHSQDILLQTGVVRSME